MEHLDVEHAHRLIRGQLDPQAQADCQRHLRDCPRCRDLVASERGFMAMVELGDTPPAGDGARVCRPVAQFAHLPGTAGAGRARALLRLFGGLAVVGALLWCLSWQLSGNGVAPDAGKSMLPIPSELQNKTVANLDALIILARDPWLADRYEDIRTFQQLVVGEGL